MSNYDELLEENIKLKSEIYNLKKEIQELQSQISTSNYNKKQMNNHSININSNLEDKINLYRSLFYG